jgi:DNA-binding transcriptional MocR family regulator
MMTILTRDDLQTTAAPRYLTIADAIGRAVRDGRLKPGERLPTHREWADELSVTLGTVTRAYREAEQRGWVRGEVGRGTFVRQTPVEGFRFDYGKERERALIDLSFNLPPVGAPEDERALIAVAVQEMARRSDLLRIMHYQPIHSAAEHREAGAMWLRRSGLDTRPENVLISSGSQHGLFVALAATTQPGDEILTEALTFPGVKSAAQLLHLRLRGVSMDENGIRPEALEQACRAGTAKALYLVPTIQNPTATTLSRERRHHIAKIARRAGLLVIEDDIHNLLSERPIETIASLAPETCVFIANTSKLLAPALRISYLSAPSGLIDRMVEAIQTSVWIPSPLGAALSSEWIRSGVADSLLQSRRREARERQTLAAKIMAGWTFRGAPFGYHIWLQLPRAWRMEDFALRLVERGVLVTTADTFAIARGHCPQAVRVALGGPQTREQLRAGLETVAELLRRGPTTCASVV